MKQYGYLNCDRVAFLFISTLWVCAGAYGAVGQTFNDNFFQNPAEMSEIEHLKLSLGSIYLEPKFIFKGSVSGDFGQATSKTNGTLPYFLGGYRVTNRCVIGVNVTPSSYARINWPHESILGTTDTTTKIVYYRAGALASYQPTPKLALGAGINLEINKLLELDFYVPDQGYQINQASALNYSFDFGLVYKITPKVSLKMGGYTPVNSNGPGVSSLNSIVTNDFTLNVVQSSVVFVGLHENITDKWVMAEKIYWSGWSILKNLYFTNSATGSFKVPTDWDNVWSILVDTSYAVTEKLTVLGGFTYETSASSIATNNVGYPVAPMVFPSVGLKYQLKKSLDVQIVYGYGVFIPKAAINRKGVVGSIAANIQLAGLQVTYKL